MFFRACLRLVAAALLGLAAAPGSAQQSEPTKVVGFLSHLSSDARQPCLDELRQGLIRYGWVENQNYRIEIRHANYDETAMPVRARELAALRPDVLVGSGVAPIVALRAATTTTPIVTMGSASLLTLGLVKSLAQPGTNVTGFSNGEEEHGVKLLDILVQTLPSAKRIGMVLNERNPAHHKAIDRNVQFARHVGRELVTSWFSGRDGIEQAWKTLAAQNVDAVVVLPDLSMHVRAHAGQATRLRLPAIAQPAIFVRAGGFMSYGRGARTAARCVEGARYVDRILRGQSPAGLPIEESNELELIVSLQAARELGVRIPPEIVARAAMLID